jgi:predicted nucleotidyltransferase
MRSRSLSNVLFTKTQQRVLGLLFGQPDQSFYLNKIVELAGVGRGTVNRELDRMEGAGIVFKKKIGNQNHYQANPECPIYHELLGIVRKTFGVADVIKTALEPVLGDISLAFVYGSVAIAADSTKSDIDLMIVSEDLLYSNVMELLLEPEHSLGRTINPTLYTPAEIKDKMQQENAFVVRVIDQPKIWIKEDEIAFREIRQSGQDRPAT